MFKPKFPTFRTRIVTLAILFAIEGVVLLAGRDPLRRGVHDVTIAAILALAAAIPESPEKKVTPEKYPLTGSKP